MIIKLKTQKYDTTRIMEIIDGLSAENQDTLCEVVHAMDYMQEHQNMEDAI